MCSTTPVFTRATTRLLLSYLCCSLSALFVYSQSCRNPNNNPGECISVYKCDSLLNVLKSVQQAPASADIDKLRFVSASQCDNGINNGPFVCCTSDTTFMNANNGNRNNSQNNGAGNILPEPPNCGPESFGDKIYSGSETSLDQYPWMVLLSYKNDKGDVELSCAGSLINQRYVLTAAHCIVGEIQKLVGQLYKIRLGEHNVSSEIDCNSERCNDKVVEMDYEEILVHPDYVPYNKNNYNDIALIRLTNAVTYTYFIKPVCLPVMETRQTIQPGELFIVAGWGRTLFSAKSKVKMHLAIPIVDHDECNRMYSKRGIMLTSKQFCAGGEYAKDSCDGDSGGPLMRKSYQYRWYLEGIVSFGNKCGLQGWAGVYTRVAEYIDWIQSNIRP